MKIGEIKSSDLVVPSSKMSLLSLPCELQTAILFELDYTGLMVCRQVCSLMPFLLQLIIDGMHRYVVL